MFPVYKFKWIVFGTLTLTYFFAMFHRFSPAVIAPEMMKEFGLGAATLGLLASTYFYSYGVMQIPTGIFADHIGPRKTVAMFTFLAAIGVFVFASAQNFELAVIGRLLIGVGVAVVWVCTIKIIAVWFKLREFATMNGILNLVGNVGAIAAATPLALLTILIGWRTSFLLIALIMGLLAFFVWFFVRDNPTQLGLPIIHQPEKRFMETEKIGLIDGFRITFTNKFFWFIAFSMFIWYGSLVSFQGLWAVPYLINVYGYSKPQASYLLTLIAVGFCVGAPFWGYLSDKVFGVRKPIFVLGFLAYTLTWVFLTISKILPKEVFYPIFFLIGFFSGAVIISVAMLREIFPEQIVGTAMGCVNTFIFAGAGIFQFLTGYILDLIGPIKIVEGVKIYPFLAYKLAFTFCLVGLIAASIVSFFTKETLKK